MSNGFGKSLQTLFQERACGLTHCWVWNSQNHNNQINSLKLTNKKLFCIKSIE